VLYSKYGIEYTPENDTSLVAISFSIYVK
jgi:hypothetical protein